MSLVVVDGPDTAPRHRDKGPRVGPRLEVLFNAAEEVVGFEDEQHLSWHRVEDGCDFQQVLTRVIFDLLVL